MTNTKETYKLPNHILSHLEDTINKFKGDSPKPSGFDEIVRLNGLGEITKGHLRKISSFADNYQPSDPEQKEKYKIYGKLITHARNQLKSIETKERISNKVRTDTHHPTGTLKGSQQNREVDRLNKPSTASTEPAKITYYENHCISEEVKRIKELIKRLESPLNKG